jgi:hypothetical protein
MKLIWLLPDDSTVVVMVSDIVQYLNILRSVNSVSLGFVSYKIVSIEFNVEQEDQSICVSVR